MSTWSMAIETGGTGADLAAARLDTDGVVPVPAGPDDPPGADATAGPDAPAGPDAANHRDGVDTDPDALVDALAAALAAAAERAAALRDDDGTGDGPDRLWIVTPADADRRHFEDLAEATALAGLPVPGWLPAPVALVGEPLAARCGPGATAVVLDARAARLTAWPVLLTTHGAEIGGRGPIAVAERLDQLLVGVVRATLQVTAPEVVARLDDGTGPGARHDAARLRRELRRARRTLATGHGDRARVPLSGTTAVLERAVFEQLVAHAVDEAIADLTGRVPTPVELLGDPHVPLVRHLAAVTGASAVVPGGPGAALRGVCALARTRAVRPAHPDDPVGDGTPVTGPVPITDAGSPPERGRPARHRAEEPRGSVAPPASVAGPTAVAPRPSAGPADVLLGPADTPSASAPGTGSAGSVGVTSPGSGAAAPDLRSAEADEAPVDPTRLRAVAETPPRPARRRPRWVVPALAVLLVLAVAAAIGLLVLGPRIVAAPPPPGPAVAGPVVPVPGLPGGGPG